MQAPFDAEGNGAPSNDMAVLQESPAAPGEHAQDGNGGLLEATFEERFEQFYLQLAEGKTGGMVVRATATILLPAVLCFRYCVRVDECAL